MKLISKINLLLILLVFASCSKDDDTIVTPETSVATLSSVSPSNGPKTRVVTIHGNNFGTDQNNVQVFFNGKEAIVQAVTETEITTAVPARAYTGLVTVIVNGTELTGPEFNYLISDVQVSTFAGSTRGYEDGLGTDAKFDGLTGSVIDSQGNIFIADNHYSRIRKITPDGMVSTFAGSTQGDADGVGADAKFNLTYGLAIDADDNLYVVDSGNYKIRKITPDAVVSTLAGSVEGDVDAEGENAQFGAIYGIVVGPSGNIFVTDISNHKIRKITPDGVVSTYAGGTEGDADGTAHVTQFNGPLGLAADADGNIYVSDTSNHKIRKITPEGVISTIAGTTIGFKDGLGAVAQFTYPIGITLDKYNNIYIVDRYNHRIRKILSNGLVITLAGSTADYEDGAGVDAKFNRPYNLVIDNNMTLFVSDGWNYKLRKITQE